MASPPPLPDADDPLLHLPRSLYYQVVHDLHRSLPPPADDSAEAQAHRIQAAIAEVASMLPANAEEASMAAGIVGARAQAMDCQRLARLFPNDPAHVLRCTAQSAAMTRAANSTRALLLRVQAARQKREADADTCDKAAWVEHCAAGLMVNALPEAIPEPASPPAAPQEDRFSRLTEAERYAVLYPGRAALIRSLGRVPDNCSFGPPEPELVEAILASTSPILLDLDQTKGRGPA